MLIACSSWEVFTSSNLCIFMHKSDMLKIYNCSSSGLAYWSNIVPDHIIDASLTYTHLYTHLCTFIGVWLNLIFWINSEISPQWFCVNPLQSHKCITGVSVCTTAYNVVCACVTECLRVNVCVRINLTGHLPVCVCVCACVCAFVHVSWHKPVKASRGVI